LLSVNRHFVVAATVFYRLQPPSFRFAVWCGLGAFAVLAAWLPGAGELPAAEPVARASGVAVEEMKPELYYLEDDAGGLVPVPGFRYRDFVDLIRLREGLPGLPELPGAVLERIRVKVTMPTPSAADQQTATVSVEAVLRQARAGWVMLPLKLPEVVITEPPETTGNGQVIVTVDQAPADDPRTVTAAKISQEAGGELTVTTKPVGGNGFLVWINGREPMATEPFAGEPDADRERHTVILRGRIPVDMADHRDLFVLTLPAAASSEVQVISGRSQPRVSLDPRVLAPVIRPLEKEEATGSVISLAGLVGPTRISLADVATASPVTVEAPEVIADTEVRVNGRTARMSTVLRLTKLPDSLRQLTIALPPRAVAKSVGGQASLVARRGTPEAAEVVVRLDDVRDGTASIELLCERVIDAVEGKPFDVGGFSVSGVPEWRQWGRTSIFTTDDRQVDWEPRAGNRRIDALPAAQQPGFVAAFAYDTQPVSLPLRVRPRSSRTVIEPEYRYHVSASRVALDIRLRAAIRGVPADRIRVAVPGWEIEEVGPPGVVDAASVTVDNGLAVVPFLQPLAGDVVIELRCSRAVDRSVDSLRWTTPVPQADLVGPGSLVITSDAEIELIPENEFIEGMSRQVATSLERAGGDSLQMAYRVEASEAIFAATRRFLGRQIDASVVTQIDIAAAMLTARQVLRLDVAHVPLEFVEWQIPETLLNTGNLEVRQNGELLTPEVVGMSAGEEVGSPATAPSGESSQGSFKELEDQGEEPAARQSMILMRTLLPEPLLGSGELVLRYRQPLPQVPEETTVAVSVPLLLPENAIIGREALTLEDTGGFTVEVRDDRWSREGDIQTLGIGRTWNATEDRDAIDLAISRRQEDVDREAVVEAAWVRTTLRPARRIDHWTYALTSTADRLPLLLPTAEVNDNAAGQFVARVRIDGGPWQEVNDTSGRFEAELTQGGTHLLEIEVQQPRQPAVLAGLFTLPGWITLQKPALPFSTIYRQVVWELLPPADQALLAGPTGWTSQQSWGWTRFGFQPVPLVSVADLVDWVVESVDPEAKLIVDELAAPDRASERRLVFWDIGTPAAVRVLFVPWWLLVLAGSGLPLLIGMVRAFRPAVGRWLLVVLAIAFLAGMALVPLTTLLLGQAAIPGFVLAVGALLASWWRTLKAGSFWHSGEPVSWVDHRGDSVTQAAEAESLVINMQSSVTSHDLSATATHSAAKP
jgi:hypothetical protein